MKNRNLEIDFLRGVAIIMMIVFHFLFDLRYFFDFNINLTSGFWNYFQITTASLFLLLVGSSLTLSNKKFKQNILRGFKIFLLGLVITFFTYFIFKDGFILFGILHLIGLSIIIVYFLIPFKYLNLILGIIFIILGNYIKNIDIGNNLFLMFGFTSNYYSVDYYPIFPWIGVILIGIYLGNLFKELFKKRSFIFRENKFTSFMEFLGRKSLIIYFLHQIILFGGFYLVSLLL